MDDGDFEGTIGAIASGLLGMFGIGLGENAGSPETPARPEVNGQEYSMTRVLVGKPRVLNVNDR